jgi:hypothetical protein
MPEAAATALLVMDFQRAIVGRIDEDPEGLLEGSGGRRRAPARPTCR